MSVDQRNAEAVLLRAGEVVIDELLALGVLGERPAPEFVLDFGQSGAAIASQIAAIVREGQR
jgi:hypothetical protein